MVTITEAEREELALYDALMSQSTTGISGHIQNLSKQKYGIPKNVSTFWEKLDHAEDLDIVDWGLRCVQDACPSDQKEHWISPTGQTSLYGVIMPELCRRLAWWAYREDEARTVAAQPTGAVVP